MEVQNIAMSVKQEPIPLSKQKSLLSQMLAEMAANEASVSACEEVEDVMEEELLDEEDGEDEDQENDAQDGEEEDDDAADMDVDGELQTQPSSSSRPVKIRKPSSYLHNQREAHKRFLYLHLVEEMRKEATAYFHRMARAKMETAVDEQTVLPPQ